MAQEDRQREPVTPAVGDATDDPFSELFLPFLRLFEGIRDHEKLFPKECRVCGKTFGSYPEYVRDTFPKGHVLEDCSDVMKRALTMTYRHCGCGNTLILTFTDEVLRALDELWAMLRQEAELTGKPLRQVVKEFGRQCDRYIVSRFESSAGSAAEHLYGDTV